MTNVPHQLSATDAARLIRAGDLTSEELVRSCLDRISERDEAVGAWEYLDRDRAVAEARRRDAEEGRGPLHGVPIGIKDIIDTADQPTAFGSAIYAGRRSPEDAVCVRRLRDAGAVIVGKTVTTEFALFRPGKTANPHDSTRTPGGSSSGSAAAVADYHVPVALGTQTAGSIVRPAAYCGVFGLKPTYGAFDLSGIKMISPSLDTLGHLARTPDDLALVAAVLSGQGSSGFDLGSMESSDGAPVAFVRTPQWGQVTAADQEVILRAVDRLAGEAEVKEVKEPEVFAGLVDAQKTIMEYEAVHSFQEERRLHWDQLSDQLRAVLERGRATSHAAYDEALGVAGECRHRLPELFRTAEVLLAPCVLGEAPRGLDATGDPLLCRSWTLLGTPTVAVPGLRGPDGLPLGVQVIAPRGQDTAALSAARWIAPRLR